MHMTYTEIMASLDRKEKDDWKFFSCTRTTDGDGTVEYYNHREMREFIRTFTADVEGTISRLNLGERVHLGNPEDRYALNLLPDAVRRGGSRWVTRDQLVQEQEDREYSAEIMSMPLYLLRRAGAPSW